MLKSVVVLSLIWSLIGCSSLRYYAQAVSGHTKLLLQRKSVEEAIERADLDPNFRQKLSLTRTIRAFAGEAGLDTGDAYTTYVETGQPYVVWNVFAAPEFSGSMKQFCFPIVGCAAYKGYFKKDDAVLAAADLSAQGYDVYVGGVAAYSTLGWFSDPILDSFLIRTDSQLAALIFHELAHRELYVKGDSQFNESFATTVERFLLEKWLRAEHRLDELNEYESARQRQTQVLDLVREARSNLTHVYNANTSLDEKRKGKAREIEALRSRYRQIRENWQGHDDYHEWMTTDLNNAKPGTLSTYHDWVDSFDVLLAEENHHIPAFIKKAKTLASLSRRQRDRTLTALINP